MHDTLPSAPSRTEVRTALLWALEHDRDALLEAIASVLRG